MLNPVAFSVFGIDIMWYALLIMLGVIMALITTKINVGRRKELNLSFDAVLDGFLYAFPLALLGARVYYVIFEWDMYRDNLWQILNVRGGGLAIHGGLIGAVIGVLIYKLKEKKSAAFVLNHTDAVAPGLVLAQAIGRWGNFVNQEAHGGPVSQEFISRFPSFIQEGMLINGQYYHPTFLYESLWNILVFVALMLLYRKRKRDHEGTILAWYMVLYSSGRFFIESLRTDSLMIGPLRTAQLISVLMFTIGAAYLAWKYTRKPQPEAALTPAAEGGITSGGGNTAEAPGITPQGSAQEPFSQEKKGP